MSREEPILYMGEKVRKVLRDIRSQSAKKHVRLLHCDNPSYFTNPF
jgi:hypothetical protein